MLSDYIAPISTITASELMKLLEIEKQEKKSEEEGEDDAESN